MMNQKNPESQTQKPQSEKLLRLKTGYDQHASHTQLNADLSRVEQDMFTVLWEMKKKGLSESTMKNTRKALSFLGPRRSFSS
jgi:hypothetical protein